MGEEGRFMSDLQKADFPEHIRALQQSGLLHADITLAAIVAAAQRIPSLSGGDAASWELISRDFVWRGLADGPASRINEAAVAVLKDARILNFDITLGAILEMSQRIPGLGGGDVASWELISRDFVWRGSMNPGDINVIDAGT